MKFGGWSKSEAGIADDVAKLEVRDKTWEVLIDHTLFDTEDIWVKHAVKDINDYRFALFEP